MGTLVVGIIVAGTAVLIIRSMIKNKRNGNSSSCGGDCGHCGGHCCH